MRSGPQNEKLKELITSLKEKNYSEEVPLFKRIAKDLEKPSRQRRVVNISRLNRHTKEGEVIVVPGKVLADGDLEHSITIFAWKFSEEALRKISESNSKAFSIFELLNGGSVKGKKLRVIG